MDKYKRFIGITVFIIAIVVMIVLAVLVVQPKYEEWEGLRTDTEKTTNTLNEKRQAKANIVKKLKKLRESVMSTQKKIYSPVESKLGNDTLFFTLYSDLIEMVRANTIKIKSIDYKYNPSEDVFVQQKGSRYFVCDVNIEVISNYVNLGKLIQDIYQYPYYIKINSIEIRPYEKDKKILLTTLNVRLYAHTAPDEEIMNDIEEGSTPNGAIDGATVPLPQ